MGNGEPGFTRRGAVQDAELPHANRGSASGGFPTRILPTHGPNCSSPLFPVELPAGTHSTQLPRSQATGSWCAESATSTAAHARRGTAPTRPASVHECSSPALRNSSPPHPQEPGDVALPHLQQTRPAIPAHGPAEALAAAPLFPVPAPQWAAKHKAAVPTLLQAHLSVSLAFGVPFFKQ